MAARLEEQPLASAVIFLVALVALVVVKPEGTMCTRHKTVMLALEVLMAVMVVMVLI